MRASLDLVVDMTTFRIRFEMYFETRHFALPIPAEEGASSARIAHPLARGGGFHLVQFAQVPTRSSSSDSIRPFVQSGDFTDRS